MTSHHMKQLVGMLALLQCLNTYLCRRTLDSFPQLPEGDAMATSDSTPVCYLCLGGDEPDQPLRRDCACRGTDAGFVHLLSCLTGYAATKSEQTDRMQEFVDPWLLCPSCHQDYQNELAIDIASEFVTFVRRQYPDDTKRQVEALYGKLNALLSMFGRLQPVQKCWKMTI